MKSIYALVLVSVIWFILGAFYYPKWKFTGSEATISWDVSGYYHYLPGIFIYHDLKKQDWMNEINNKYLPSPAYDQSFIHQPSGNKVNKYAIGQAVLYSPFFFIGHVFAKLSDEFPADGYSQPYQRAIWFGSLCFAILGLILLRVILRLYYDDRITSWTILAIGLATNFMEYASITNAMNHGWLFTLLCALILYSILFYERVSWSAAAGIGLILGLSILTRPTEIIWILIPLLWNIHTISERVNLLKRHWRKGLLSIVLCGAVMSIQSVYWKYASGEWVVYSYGEQGFSWLNPNLYKGLLGVKIGWWAYTPIMLLAMFGWRGLYKQHRRIFWPVFLVVLLSIYITTSWKHFLDAGGLGQRNLIQIYPLMAFPLAMVIAYFTRTRRRSWIWIALFFIFVYFNMWWSHQAHRGGFFVGGQTTTPFFMKVIGRWNLDRDYYKLLDTHEYFDGTPVSKKYVLDNDFSQDTAYGVQEITAGNKAVRLDSANQYYGPIQLNVQPGCGDWIRVEANFAVQTYEWDLWKNAQWTVEFLKGAEVVKKNSIRVQRLIPGGQTNAHVYFDVKLPKKDFNSARMTIWNGTSKGILWMDNLKVSCFNE